jgi:hypothetical protein
LSTLALGINSATKKFETYNTELEHDLQKLLLEWKGKHSGSLLLCFTIDTAYASRAVFVRVDYNSMGAGVALWVGVKSLDNGLMSHSKSDSVTDLTWISSCHHTLSYAANHILYLISVSKEHINTTSEAPATSRHERASC